MGNLADSQSPESFFNDLERGVHSWSTVGAKRFVVENYPTAPSEDGSALATVGAVLRQVEVDEATVARALKGILMGLTHTFLVILDGGSEMARKGRLHLVDANNQPIGEA